MPEGPELHLASRFINKVCSGRIFGKICKSDISKNTPVIAPFPKFHISACSRGKEVKLILTEAMDNAIKSGIPKKNFSPNSENFEVLFTFGLAGKFDFCSPDEMQKHSHLSFYTADTDSQMVLSFVDYMRFGKWTPNATWSKDRGPCVLFEYPDFRANVLNNLEANAFNKPICEALLNQKFFNGIGNYLRAEVLYRHSTPPFVSARSVLEPLVAEVKVKSEKPDILELCHKAAMEVVNLEGDGYDLQDRADETKSFNCWLQCYYQKGMKNMADHNGRTIWFSGPAGPMAPTDVKTRARKASKKKKKNTENPPEEETVNLVETESGKRKRKARKDKNEESNKTKMKENPTAEKRLTRKRLTEISYTEQEITEPPKKVSKKGRKIKAEVKNSESGHMQDSTEQPKKLSKEGQQFKAVQNTEPSPMEEKQKLSISDLQLTVAIENKRLTRGKVKNLLSNGGNSPKTPAARTKTRARVVSHSRQSSGNATPLTKSKMLKTKRARKGLM